MSAICTLLVVLMHVDHTVVDSRRSFTTSDLSTVTLYHILSTCLDLMVSVYQTFWLCLLLSVWITLCSWSTKSVVCSECCCCQWFRCMHRSPLSFVVVTTTCFCRMHVTTIFASQIWNNTNFLKQLLVFSIDFKRIVFNFIMDTISVVMALT